MNSPFTRQTLAFLRALKRNNTREWFKPRKDEYERLVRQPMIDLLARLARDFSRFAPELVVDPRICLYRIYRDTRFSADKSPLKTHIAAHFPARGLPKHAAAGLYVEVAPQWVWMGGGLYMPSTSDLQAIREHIAAHHGRLRRILISKPFRQTVGQLTGDRLARVPRGFASDHPAAEYLRYRQFLAGRELEGRFATSDDFYPELVRTFSAIMPLVRFLNAPLQGGGSWR